MDELVNDVLFKEKQELECFRYGQMVILSRKLQRRNDQGTAVFNAMKYLFEQKGYPASHKQSSLCCSHNYNVLSKDLPKIVDQLNRQCAFSVDIVKLLNIDPIELFGIKVENKKVTMDKYDMCFLTECLVNPFLTIEEVRYIVDLFEKTCSKIEPIAKSWWQTKFTHAPVGSRIFKDANLLKHVIVLGAEFKSDSPRLEQLDKAIKRSAKANKWAVTANELIRSTIKDKNTITK